MQPYFHALSPMLRLVLYFDRPCVNPAKLLQELIGACASWQPSIGVWEGILVCREDNALNPVVQIRGVVSEAEIIERTAIGSTGELVVCTSLKYRLRTGQGEAAEALVGLDSYVDRSEADPTELPNGCAEVTLFAPESYNVDRRGDGFQESLANVHANWLDVMSLLRLLAEAVDPSAIKMYERFGLKIPLNAMFAYYRDLEALKQDLRMIKHLYDHGWPRNFMPPLSELTDEDVDSMFFGAAGWLARLELLVRLSETIGNIDSVDASHVAAARASDAYYFWEELCRGESFALSGNDIPPSSLLWRFYLEVLSLPRRVTRSTYRLLGH